jgi:thioesterase domain-containing protein
MASLLRASTVERMAELLGAGEGTEVWSSLVAIQPHGRRPPLFCVHAAGGHVLFYRDLAARLGPDQPVFGLQAQGLDGTGRRHARIEDMAADYVREIRSIRPRGPYYLAGSSFGGLVAYEMAQQLTGQGDEVALLALFDAYGEGYPKYLPQTMWWHRAAYGLELRVRHHWGSLVMLPRDQRWPYVAAKWRQGARAVGNAILRVRRGLGRKACAVLGRPFNEAGPLEAKQLRERYVLKPYGGRITLFRASVQPRGTYRDESLGWAALAQGGLDVHEVPGNHGAIVVEPRVRFLVEKLRPCLG